MFGAKQTAIEEFFQDGLSSHQLVFENMGGVSPELFDEYLRLTVQFGDSYRMQIGGQAYRHPGLVMVQVMVKEGVGVSRAMVLADEVKDLFLEAVHEGINFQVPYVTKQPVSEEGWFQVQVSVPFYFDEVI